MTCEEPGHDAERVFAAHPKCALGFSGGVDSAYLLYAGVRAGADIRPYYIKTAFQPRFEQDDALRLAGELGVEVTVLELDAWPTPGWRPTRRSGATTASRTCSAR